MRIYTVMALLPLFFWGCSRGPSKLEIVETFMAAYNMGDIDSVLALLAPDIKAEFTGMGPPLAGKNSFRNKLEYDTTLDAHITLYPLRPKGDSIIYRAEEMNSWLAAAGLPHNIYSDVIIVVIDHKIASLHFELSDSSIAAINNLMYKLIPWAQTNYPREFALLASEEPPYFSPTRARAALALVENWRKTRTLE